MAGRRRIKGAARRGTTDVVEETAEPKDQPTLDDEGIHTMAHCIWWVAKGDDLPEEAEARNQLWQREQYEWVRLARLALRHMEYNRLTVTRISD